MHPVFALLCPLPPPRDCSTILRSDEGAEAQKRRFLAWSENQDLASFLNLCQVFISWVFLLFPVSCFVFLSSRAALPAFLRVHFPPCCPSYLTFPRFSTKCILLLPRDLCQAGPYRDCPAKRLHGRVRLRMHGRTRLSMYGRQAHSQSQRSAAVRRAKGRIILEGLRLVPRGGPIEGPRTSVKLCPA
ncbi:unnamed protein product [Phaeothamnion confervicola]